jgi:hypothetical protein
VRAGVWCRKPGFDDIELAASLGFKRLDVMVHEVSKARTPVEFKLDWDASAYQNVVGKAMMEGIEEVHFTAWAMPYVTYMAYAGDTLQHLCQETGAHGIVLDAEEPWTLAKRPDYGSSATTFFAQAKGCRTGITGIGYANFDKLEPLCRNADYLVPQCYSTNTSKVLPDRVGKLADHWSRRFPDKLIVPGLAAYRQSGIDGYTTRTAMRTARAQFACAEFPDVIYWSLRQIKGSALIRETLRKMLAEQNEAKEGAA